MKRIFYLSLFLLISLSTTKANSPYLLEGIYTNPDTYEEIIVRSNQRGLRIQGLSRRNPGKWIRFVRNGRTRFIDRNGNKLRITGSRNGYTTIIFNPRRGPNRIYQAGIWRDNRNSCGTFSGRNGGRYYGYDHLDRDRDWDRRRRYDDFNGRDDFNNNGFNGSYFFEGTYKTRDGRSIAILDTRTGFKAKFRGERTWKRYERKGDRFVDNDGNFYRVTSQNKLIWHGKFSGKQIEVIKESDEVLF